MFSLLYWHERCTRLISNLDTESLNHVASANYETLQAANVIDKRISYHDEKSPMTVMDFENCKAGLLSLFASLGNQILQDPRFRERWKEIDMSTLTPKLVGLPEAVRWINFYVDVLKYFAHYADAKQSEYSSRPPRDKPYSRQIWPVGLNWSQPATTEEEELASIYQAIFSSENDIGQFTFNSHVAKLPSSPQQRAITEKQKWASIYQAIFNSEDDTRQIPLNSHVAKLLSSTQLTPDYQWTSIVAQINYLNPDPLYDDERPYAIASDPPPGLKKTNITQVAVETEVYNVRGREDEFSLYSSGFQWVHHSLAYNVNVEQNVDRYMEDMGVFLQSQLKASHVVVYDFVVGIESGY